MGVVKRDDQHAIKGKVKLPKAPNATSGRQWHLYFYCLWWRQLVLGAQQRTENSIKETNNLRGDVFDRYQGARVSHHAYDTCCTLMTLFALVWQLTCITSVLTHEIHTELSAKCLELSHCNPNSVLQHCWVTLLLCKSGNGWHT